MKLYRKKEKLVVTAFVALLVGLLLVSCPDSGGSDNGGLPVIPPGPPPPPPEYTHDFTTPGAGALLFGTSMEYLTTAADYSTGDNVISLMNERWDNACNFVGGDGTTKFYPISSPTTGIIVVDGENVSGCGIYGTVPQMIFLLKGSNLTVWGRNNGADGVHSISFDIAIINSDGFGWLNQGTAGIPYDTLGYIFGESGSKPFSLSSLTAGSIKSVSGLANYNVYIIVRGTTAGSSFGNFNTSVLSNRNVIKPQIR